MKRSHANLFSKESSSMRISRLSGFAHSLALRSTMSSITRALTIAIAIVVAMFCGRMTALAVCPGSTSHECVQQTSNDCSSSCITYTGPAVCDVSFIPIVAVKLGAPNNPWYYCASTYWPGYSCAETDTPCGVYNCYMGPGCTNSCPVTNGPYATICAPDLINSNPCGK
jgi:hypothetical protein